MKLDLARDSQASIRRHIIAGSVIVGVLAIGFGGWASTAEISGALIAQGTIVVDSNIKKVQHPTGGVVGEVRVHDGDRVKAGEVDMRAICSNPMPNGSIPLVIVRLLGCNI